MKLVLVHEGGEKREVTLILAAHNVLTFEWPMCGYYDLDLRTNVVQYTHRGRRRVLRGWHAESLTVAGLLYTELAYRRPDKPTSEAREFDRKAYEHERAMRKCES